MSRTPTMTSAGRTMATALALALAPSAVQAQWTVHMRAMQNPLPVGQCTAIEVVALEPSGHAPLRPDGRQASGWDFELDFTAATPDAFAWRDESRRFLCALTPTAPSAMVVARYPGRHLKPAEIVPGVVTQQTVEVAMQGMQPAAGQFPVSMPAPGNAAGASPTAYHGSPPPDPYADASAPGNYPAAGNAPKPSYPQPTASQPAYPEPTSSPPAYPQPAYPQPPGPQSGSAPVMASTPVPVPAPAPAPPAAAPKPEASTAKSAKSGDGRVRTGKQFLKRLLGHARKTASDVATSTAGYVADAAGEVVDTAVKSVMGGPQENQDLAAEIASGRVVLGGLKFVEGTAQVDPSSGPLLAQLAAAVMASAGQYLIEAHVDGTDPSAAQSLSNQRAGAVKSALAANGVPAAQLMAVGYGASRPIQGAASSARIEIARTQ